MVLAKLDSGIRIFEVKGRPQHLRKKGQLCRFAYQANFRKKEGRSKNEKEREWALQAFGLF